MIFLRSVRNRRKLKQIFWIALFWGMIGALDALNTQAITSNAQLEEVLGYDFFRYFWVNTLSAFFSGIFSGAILLFFLRERLRHRSFGFALLVNSFFISLLNFMILAVAYNIFLSIDSGENVLDSKVIERTNRLINSTFYLKNLVFWTIVTFLTIVLLHVTDKYGPGVLAKLLLGRYHKPREEERIFMFADIKSSTAIAERLGHTRFFSLLNDYFRDLTNAIIDTSGEIYQYVGDEIIISWTIDEGIENANCIRCFYAMQEAILKRSQRYQDKYGVVPTFKAGLHCGVVTTGEIGLIKKDIVFSGDVLNTASRLQDLCNRFGVYILLSKYLLDKLNLPPDLYKTHRMGIIELKGRRQKVEVYTFKDNTDDKAPEPVVNTT